MIEENRLSCDAHLLLTVIYAADGDTAGALAAVRRALYIAPSSVSAHLLNSTLLARLGKLDAAQRASTTASRLLAADVAGGSRASLPLEAALLSPFGSLEPREK
jgi:Tfp pilus assembly protein PilF